MTINRCTMCRCNWESVEHLLIHSPNAQDLWSSAPTAFGVTWVMPRQVIELMFTWGVYARHQNHVI